MRRLQPVASANSVARSLADGSGYSERDRQRNQDAGSNELSNGDQHAPSEYGCGDVDFAPVTDSDGDGYQAADYYTVGYAVTNVDSLENGHADMDADG